MKHGFKCATSGEEQCPIPRFLSAMVMQWPVATDQDQGTARAHVDAFSVLCMITVARCRTTSPFEANGKRRDEDLHYPVGNQFYDGVNLCIGELRSVSITLVDSDGLLGAYVGVRPSGLSGSECSRPLMLISITPLNLSEWKWARKSSLHGFPNAWGSSSWL